VVHYCDSLSEGGGAKGFDIAVDGMGTLQSPVNFIRRRYLGP